ncbi:hypothetical protein [Corynebacterium qintianiae]|uniref:hypothetical protein n=1 Tax=Corynebacterium qintianiae TaxID=2709392 RepID=UPI002017F77E|nr:hypothetical protein [Corynebacterium qintianiae]
MLVRGAVLDLHHVDWGGQASNVVFDRPFADHIAGFVLCEVLGGCEEIRARVDDG